MENIKWDNYDWYPSEIWGQIHPEKQHVWYDSSAIEVKDNSLLLKTQYNPKYFEDLDLTSPMGVGLVTCLEKFEYGTFSLDAMLPSGKHLWPAFWLYSWDKWPPEIDVFEAYTNGCKSYLHWSWEMLLGKFWKVETNVHLGKTPNNYSLGAKWHFFGFKNPKKHFINYKVEWFPDKIEIYYNGRSVRKITDEETLRQFENTTMRVIINNSVIKGDSESTLIVKNFLYKKY